MADSRCTVLPSHTSRTYSANYRCTGSKLFLPKKHTAATPPLHAQSANQCWRDEWRFCMCPNPFCFRDYWCVDWDCCSRSSMEDQPPPSKKRKTTKALGDRFVTPLSPSSMDRVCRGFVPKNMKKATSWALHVFQQWRMHRNCATAESCPENLLEYRFRICWTG